jgi:formylglycine-generating enzyme required for sulfatase activity
MSGNKSAKTSLFIALCILLQACVPAVRFPIMTPEHPTITLIIEITRTLTPTNTPELTTSPTMAEAHMPTVSGLPVEITDEKGVKMRLVSAGEFTMGSNADNSLTECQKYFNGCERWQFADEDPPHTVMINDYYMDVYEVTNLQYASCVDSGKCTSPYSTGSYTRSNYFRNSAYMNFPVTSVNWNQAKTFCDWRGARLPTEAEWEKAARGIDGRTYPWGNAAPSSSLANYISNDSSNDTTEVGSYENGKSPYGMYDMAGNVWEWVADWYDSNYYQTLPAENPQGPSSGDYRVLRGGSWDYNLLNLRSSIRNWNLPSYWLDDIGFRCSRSTASP